VLKFISGVQMAAAGKLAIQDAGIFAGN